MRFYSLPIICVLSCTPLFAQTTNPLAPGAPGADAHWPGAAKNGFGTSNTLSSKVWFTLTNGVMTEVFYPTLDVPNIQTLELIVCREGQCASENEELLHELRVLNRHSLSFQQINSTRNGTLLITKTYTTDPDRSTVLIDVEISSPSHAAYQFYVYYDPSLNNSGMHDTAWNTREALLAVDQNISSALMTTSGFEEVSNGYLGTSDGVTQLKEQGRLKELYARAENGNVVQVARLRSAKRFTIALGFGSTVTEALGNVRASLKKGFSRAREEYDEEWEDYVSSLRPVKGRYRAQYNMAAMVLKGLEDKTHRGAMIASPSNPWGAGPNANEANTTGYHTVWPRDLYHVATAFIAMGDRATAERALDFLFKSQQNADGSFPQNTRVDGRPIGNGLQMDQVALPIVLAFQLGSTNQDTWLKHIKPAAGFIMNRGPATEQERWEEESGYSPSTIAAEIAALACAAEIAEKNNDNRAAQSYRDRADLWAREIERWTITSSGPHARHGYFIRTSDNENPDDGARLEINSGGGTYDEREIVDAGFLELVRLGIKSPNDLQITRSLAVIDRVVRVQTPHGPAWYRYNHDSYGEQEQGGPYDGKSGKGRLWPLLTGERAEYDLALGNKKAAKKKLKALMGFANEGRMIPEQVWDQANSPRPELTLGEGTGSATPLAWSMAQFIRLAINHKDKQNLDTPSATKLRYLQYSPTRHKRE
jgi:glucoamylase